MLEINAQRVTHLIDKDMHTEAFEYVKNKVNGMHFSSVVEFGSRNVNGSVKPLFDCGRYWGIDIVDGDMVDEVADARNWDCPWDDVGAVVCCEVLEHLRDMRDLINCAYKALAPGGMFIVTCATSPRAPHSAVDGGPVRPGEYYSNVPMERLEIAMLHAGFNEIRLDLTNFDKGDLYATAYKE